MILEKYPCDDVLQATKREKFWSDELHSTLNKNVPSRTVKEWAIDNKASLSKYQKIYYKDNKESLAKYQKIYNKNNEEKINNRRQQKFQCNCGGSYKYTSKTNHCKTRKHINHINSLEV